jgi:GTP-binding protein
MRITEVEFVKSVVDVRDLPTDNLKEIAFAGRSNVGKSSLINRMLGRKKMAKISSTPGKTRQLNYFRINNAFYLVDLPGYGFAKVSKREKEQWLQLITDFVTQSRKLVGVVSLIDSRIGPTKLDIQLLEWLHELKKRTVIVATKADKLSNSALAQKVNSFRSVLSVYSNAGIIPFSATRGTGKKELWREIMNLME